MQADILSKEYQQRISIRVNEMLDTLVKAIANEVATGEALEKALMQKIAESKTARVALGTGAVVGAVVGPVMASDIAQKFAQPQAGHVQTHNPNDAENYARKILAKVGQYGSAYAADRVWIGDVYEQAKPVDDPRMPKGLRWFRTGTLGEAGRTTIGSNETRKPENYTGKFWDKIFFGSKYHNGLKTIFQKSGYDSNKIVAFFNNHRNARQVSLYFDGYIILDDQKERKTYMLNVGEKCIKDIMAL